MTCLAMCTARKPLLQRWQPPRMGSQKPLSSTQYP
jgi:hypothetical protein